MSVLSIAALQTKINNWIKTNGNNEITGAQMNEVLIDMVDSLINRLDDTDMLGLAEYDPATTYDIGVCTVKDGVIYQATAQTTGTFAPADWAVLYYRNGKLYSIAARAEDLVVVGLGVGVDDTYALPAATLMSDGDELVVSAALKVIGGDTGSPAAWIDFGAVLGVAGADTLPSIKQDQILKLEYRIVRESNSQLRFSSSFIVRPDPTVDVETVIVNKIQTVAGLNLTSNAYNIHLCWIDFAGGTRTGMAIEEFGIELKKQLA